MLSFGAAYIVFINVLAFVLFAIDKNHAVNHLTRIPEPVLLWTARLGGGLGCAIGMYALHHKKKKPKFMFRVPIWTLIWMFVIVIIISGVQGGDFLNELKHLRY